MPDHQIETRAPEFDFSSGTPRSIEVGGRRVDIPSDIESPTEIVMRRGGRRGIITRRSFIRGGAVLGLGTVVYKLLDWVFWDRLSNPEWKAKQTGDFGPIHIESQPVKKQEVVLLYLFKGAADSVDSHGIRRFVREVAVAAGGINKENYKRVNFMNRSTWGLSDISLLFKGFDSFLRHVLTEEGRNILRSYIMTYGGDYREDYLRLLEKLDSYRNYKQLPASITEEDLKTFFMVSKEEMGLGYTEEEAELVFDILGAYRNNSFTEELKQRINEMNEESGTRFRIP